MPTSQLTRRALDQAADTMARSTSHPGAIAGRGAQTANAENAAGSEPHKWTDVWSRTWDGMNHSPDDNPPLGLMPATGVATPLTVAVARNVLGPAINAGTGTAVGRLGGNALGLGVAAYEGVKTARGVWTGLSGEWQSSDVGEGSRQQLDAVWGQLKTLFHAGDGQPPQGVLGHFGALMGVVTEVEQLLSVLASAVPSPALPAVRVMDLDVGLPHSHAHPPNVPGPGPIPSTGPVIPIPYVSGAATVLINGLPAARCGDMGLGVWCGGYFPLFEIFLGSSSVWLEGARAARAPTDVTKHCIFSNPKSIVKGNDLPIGPPIGIPVGSSPNVLIGGIPLPSLTAMAMAAGFKGLGKLVTKVPGFSRVARAAAAAGKKGKRVLGDIRHLGELKAMRKPGQGTVDLLKDYVKARRVVGDLLDSGKIEILDVRRAMTSGDKGFREWAERDLRMMATTPAGRQVLDDIALSPHKVIIEPIDGVHVPPGPMSGPHCGFLGDPADAFKPGVGTGSRVRLDPDFPYTRETPSHRVLTHEMGHAANNGMGTNSHFDPQPPGFDQSRWTDMEEFDVINNVDNLHADAWGLPRRNGHNHTPGFPTPPPPTPPPGVGPSGTLPGLPAGTPPAGPSGTVPGFPAPPGRGGTGPMPVAPAPTPPGRGGTAPMPAAPPAGPGGPPSFDGPDTVRDPGPPDFT